MTKRKKKIILSVVIAILISPLLVYLFWLSVFYIGIGTFDGSTTSNDIKEAKYYEESWTINLPDNIENIYTQKYLGFMGDGERYSMCKMEAYPTEFIKSLNWYKNDSEEAKAVVEKIQTTFQAVDLTQLNDATLNEEYIVTSIQEDLKKIFIVYFEKSATLHILHLEI